MKHTLVRLAPLKLGYYRTALYKSVYYYYSHRREVSICVKMAQQSLEIANSPVNSYSM